MEEDNCEVCHRIKCKNCGWEPKGLELQKVIAGTLTNCPDCGSSK